MTIDDLLTPTQEFVDSYTNKISIGINYMSQQDVVFLGLARNVDQKINRIIPFLLNLPFKTTNMVVFENDSSDSTKIVLNNLSNQYSNLKVFTNNFNAPHLPLSKNSERTIALAKYRNFCKEYIKNNLLNCKYTIVIDLDFIDISVRGLYNTFGWFAENETISAIAGNSFQLKHLFNNQQKNLWNYDSWAFRDNWWNDKQNEIRTYDPMLWFGFWIPFVGSPLIKVNSAFGGMCTYKTNLYVSEEYEGYDCEHVCFHKNLHKKYPNFNLCLNPSQTMLFE
jgi:hypothetical protein